MNKHLASLLLKALDRWVANPHLRKIIANLTHLAAIGQPSPVAFPTDLLALGGSVLIQGVLTNQGIEANKDWLLPYWLGNQLDPDDPAYLPRGMNPFLLNQTHRNWTATGLPDSGREVIVDPRGLVTPWFDGWSLDTFVVCNGEKITPARLKDYTQTVELGFPRITGTYSTDSFLATTTVWVDRVEGQEILFLTVDLQALRSPCSGVLAVSVRPYNPEGLRVCKSIRVSKETWFIEDRAALVFSQQPESHRLSDFRRGDACNGCGEETAAVTCEVGFATGVAYFTFDLSSAERKQITVTSSLAPSYPNPLYRGTVRTSRLTTPTEPSAEVKDQWRQALGSGSAIAFPDQELQRSFETNRMWLLLMDDGEFVHPGPLTYHHHWFRDSAFMLNAFCLLGLGARAKAKIAGFAAQQQKNGYYLSQNGEWDSTGQALWTIMRYYRLTGDRATLAHCFPGMLKGGRWIARTRMLNRTRDSEVWGLLPAGFSAEHFGPNDYYLWDNFWALAGLREASAAGMILNFPEDAKELDRLARSYERDLQRVLAGIQAKSGTNILPPSPLRKPDAASIGSIVSFFPLQLMSYDSPPIKATSDYLYETHVRNDGFFHSITHAGINAYLTCHLAHCLLAAGDNRCHLLIKGLLRYASPTATWPEAVHPRTGGGCMGDGMHGWASAEWLVLLRSLLVYELPDSLIFLPCLPMEWLKDGCRLSLEQAPTRFGMISLDAEVDRNRLILKVKACYSNVPIMTSLRVPAKAKSVMIDGKSVERDRIPKESDLLRLPPQVREVIVTFARKLLSNQAESPPV